MFFGIKDYQRSASRTVDNEKVNVRTVKDYCGEATMTSGLCADHINLVKQFMVTVTQVKSKNDLGKSRTSWWRSRHDPFNIKLTEIQKRRVRIITEYYNLNS